MKNIYINGILATKEDMQALAERYNAGKIAFASHKTKDGNIMIETKEI